MDDRKSKKSRKNWQTEVWLSSITDDMTFEKKNM